MTRLNDFKNKNVYVKLQHKLFGSQTARIKNFQPIFTDNEVGFKTNTQFISLKLNEITVSEINNGICIADKDLSIFLTL
jgi:hypothetical protein